MIKQEMQMLKNNSLFRSCISKINKTFIDNAKDLDTVMPIICYSIARIILWHQQVCGIFIELK